MDTVRTVWANVVIGALSLKDTIFVDEGVSKLNSDRSNVANSCPDSTIGTIMFDIVIIILVVATVLLGIVAFGIVMFISHTIGLVFPLLISVEENGTHTNYEPVRPEDEKESEKVPKHDATQSDGEDSIIQTRPVTSSFRSTFRLLCADRGFRGIWRGLKYHIVHITMVFITEKIIISILPFGSGRIISDASFLVAHLLTVPIAVAWTHSVISDQSGKSYWSRLPPFKLAYRATVLPTLLVDFATYIPQTVQFAVRKLADGWFSAYVVNMLVAGIGFWFFLVIVVPANAMLARVRASLLPEEDKPILVLDKALTLHRASGAEYMTIKDAWATLSRAAWSQLIWLHNMILIISFLAFLVGSRFIDGVDNIFSRLSTGK